MSAESDRGGFFYAQYEALAEQVDLVRRALAISRGTEFPLRRLERVVTSGGMIWDLGCGPGDKTLRMAGILASKNVGILGIDVNPEFIRLANRSKNNDHGSTEFVVGDVAYYARMSDLAMRNRPSVVVANGLFCSLVGNLTEKTLFNINDALVDGGSLLVADCLQITESYHPTFASFEEGHVKGEMEWEGGEGDKQYYYWYNSWMGRYAHNTFLGIPWGTFVVMPSGEENRSLEKYSRGNELADLIRLGKIERFARHFERQEIIDLFRYFGFALQWGEFRVWRTRSGSPLPGFVAEFRKVVNLTKADPMLSWWFREKVGN